MHLDTFILYYCSQFAVYVENLYEPLKPIFNKNNNRPSNFQFQIFIENFSMFYLRYFRVNFFNSVSTYTWIYFIVSYHLT